MADARVTGLRYISGTRFAVGTLIDGYLAAEDEEALYEIWKKHSEWPAPLEYPGSILAITCEMLIRLDEEKSEAENEKAFKAAFGKKKVDQERAARIWKAAAENAER